MRIKQSMASQEHLAKRRASRASDKAICRGLISPNAVSLDFPRPESSASRRLGLQGGLFRAANAPASAANPLKASRRVIDPLVNRDEPS